MNNSGNHGGNRLSTAPNISNCDDVYEALVNAHSGLSDEDSAKLNARLILLLTNHIGEADIILEAIEKAGPTAAQKL